MLKVAASVGGPEQSVVDPSGAELKKWVAKLAVARKNEYLLRVAEGECSTVPGELKQQFLKAGRVAAGGKPPVKSANESNRNESTDGG